MGYNRNDRSGGGGQQGGGRNQPRQFLGGSSSTSSYSSSQRYDDDDRSGNGKGGRGRGGNNNGPRKSDRSQGGVSSSSGAKTPLQGSKSIGETRPASADTTVRGNTPIEDTDARDQSFLDVQLDGNLLMDELELMMKRNDTPDVANSELIKLTQKSSMSQNDGTPVQVVKKMLYDLMMCALERKKPYREMGGKLLAHCLQHKYLSRSVLISSLGQLLTNTVDIQIDVPKVWEYIPEFLGE